MGCVVQLAVRSLVAAVCFWVAARAAVEGSEVLAKVLKVPAEEILLAAVLGAALLVVASWEPKRSRRGGRRPRRYYR